MFGEPVTLDKNKDIAQSQTGVLMPNNTKDPEAAPGIYGVICKHFLYAQQVCLYSN
jgi:hypothetical protein